jgi:DNA-binding NarL/FixJ family response regulator
MRRLVEHYVSRPAPDAVRPKLLETLSPRELEILEYVARGMSNAEIADELVISLATVKTHVRNVLQKLELRDRVQLVVFSYELGLMQPGA